jgi:tRNA threonylcarbamoyladenosine biosynthesis protein TsaB
MNILAIETATQTGSVAVMVEDRLVAENTLTAVMTHTERLMGAIDDLVRAAALRIHDIDGIAISVGPGSFTGLRIGVTTAKSLAYSIRKPITAVPTLDALAAHYLFTEFLICPMLDARKKEVYTALYRNRRDTVERLSEYAVMPPEQVLRDLHEPVIVSGDGAYVYRQMITALLGDRAIFADAAHRLPRASLIAKLGYERFRAGQSDDCFALTPLYIRKSEAEIHWDQKHLL